MIHHLTLKNQDTMAAHLDYSDLTEDEQKKWNNLFNLSETEKIRCVLYGEIRRFIKKYDYISINETGSIPKFMSVSI